MTTRPKTKKKTMTLEDFAGAIQEDLARIERKNELLRKDVAGGFRALREDLKIVNEVMVSKADLANTLREELDKSSYVKQDELNELRARVHRLEEQLGISHERRAA